MRKLGNIFAVTLVAFALCADRATAAAPAVRPHISEVTRRVVRQLSRRFQNVVPTVKIVQHRQDGLTRLPVPNFPAILPALPLHLAQSTPFQFRLPPPAV